MDATYRKQAEFLAAWLGDMKTSGPYGITGDPVDLADSIEKALRLWGETDADKS